MHGKMKRSTCGLMFWRLMPAGGEKGRYEETQERA
jgi:hypothetical protein